MRIAAAIGIAVLVLVGSALGFVTWAVYHPERAWPWIKPLVVGRDIQVSWTSAQFKTQKRSLKNWRLDWALTGLRIARARPKLELLMDVRLAADINLGSSLRVEKFEITASTPWVYEPSAAPATTANPYERSESLRRQLSRWSRIVTVENLKITVPNVGVGPTVMSLSALKPATKESQGVEVVLGVQREKFTATTRLMFRIDQLATGGPLVRGEIDGKGPDAGLTGQFDVALPEQSVQANYKFKLHSAKTVFTAEGVGTIRSHQMAVTGRSDLIQPPGQFTSGVRGAEWMLEIPLWPGVVLANLAGRAQVTAPVSLDFVKPEVRTQLEKSCNCKWPSTVRAVLDGKIWAAHIFDATPELRPVASLAFKFDPIDNPLLHLNMAGELRVTHGKDQSFQLSPAIDANVKLPNFQALKALLELNKIMVPSPFDILQGSIEASIKTTLWQSEKGLVIPIETKVNLASTEQKVNVNGKVNLYIPADFKSMDVMLDLYVQDFIVELPPVDPVRGLPQLTKDSRLLMKPEQAVPADAFKFRLMYGVRTAKPGAVRLLSKLAKPAIPISLDLDRTAKGDTLGTIKIEPFELSYMHRTMHIDLLRMILDDRETADFAIDGLLRMEQSQAKIKIAISGSLRSPLIKLSSEPEMSRSDIISLMLYDRTSEQLVGADRETVGSFDAAIADRAIGLLGLWVFASTPIRSFAYNPLTKVYTATVQLAEGTTASIGTDWEEAAQVEVRKRLTRRWVLTASWAPSDAKEQLGKLVLQWEKRF